MFLIFGKYLLFSDFFPFWFLINFIHLLIL